MPRWRRQGVENINNLCPFLGSASAMTPEKIPRYRFNIKKAKRMKAHIAAGSRIQLQS